MQRQAPSNNVPARDNADFKSDCTFAIIEIITFIILFSFSTTVLYGKTGKCRKIFPVFAYDFDHSMLDKFCIWLEGYEIFIISVLFGARMLISTKDFNYSIIRAEKYLRRNTNKSQVFCRKRMRTSKTCTLK